MHLLIGVCGAAVFFISKYDFSYVFENLLSFNGVYINGGSVFNLSFFWIVSNSFGSKWDLVGVKTTFYLKKHSSSKSLPFLRMSL